MVFLLVNKINGTIKSRLFDIYDATEFRKVYKALIFEFFDWQVWAGVTAPF
jgi:hypothetical protein